MIARFAPVVLAAFAASALAQGGPSGRVVEYGILSGPEGKPEFVQKTARIPLRKGLRFGFCAQLEGLENCTRCHSDGPNLSNAKCTECHSEIGARQAKNVGYHARVQAPACCDAARKRARPAAPAHRHRGLRASADSTRSGRSGNRKSLASPTSQQA